MFYIRISDNQVEKMNEKHIVMLTLYDVLSCIETDENKKAFITLIHNQKERRLSRSKGNVNMTDYWFAMLEEFMNHNLSYMTQYIALLGDNDINWWRESSEKEEWVSLGFLKLSKESLVERYDCEKIKNIFSQNYKSSIFYYTFGNADFVIALRDENEEKLMKQVQDICSLTIPGVTGSPFFSYFFIDGKIEKTEKEEHWSLGSMKIIKSKECTKHTLFVEGWFVQKIDDLLKEMKEYLDKADKKMASYYQVLIQIMNVVAQYEQRTIYKDLFYMFFPPIHLFLQQLEESHDVIFTLSNQDFIKAKYITIQKMENSISKFLDDMEILLHHVGHSCRDIFNDNGRGGMPYDIPLRLCKMYIMFLVALTSVLNDKKEYEYQYCLAPLAYSRPTTAYLDFGLPAHSRLIDVQISRSMLYMPRSLLVILAHEVSHYVGTYVRKRRKRAEKYMKITIMALCYYLIPDNFLKDCNIFYDGKKQEETQLLQGYIEYLQKEIYQYFCISIPQTYNRMVQNKREKKEFSYIDEEEKFQFNIFRDDLSRCMMEVLEDRENCLDSIVNSIDNKTKEKLRLLDNSEILLSDINKIRNRIIHRKINIWENGDLAESLDMIGKVLREAFADISAVLVLDLDYEDILEAFVISEGCVSDEVLITPFLINRIALVKSVMQEKEPSKWKKRNSILSKIKITKTQEEDQSRSREFRNQLKERVDQYLQLFENSGVKNHLKEKQNSFVLETSTKNLLYCEDIFKIEKEYLSECYEQLKNNLECEEEINGDNKNDWGKSKQQRIQMIRNLFRHFAVYRISEELSFKQLFDDYDILEKWYEEYVGNDILSKKI